MLARKVSGARDSAWIADPNQTEEAEHVMESATFRKWLADRGCAFDQHTTTHGTRGNASVTVHREGRKAVIPLVGSRKRLDPRQVMEIVESLGLDPFDLPGEKSRV
jgi:mRNA interferase HicA